MMLLLGIKCTLAWLCKVCSTPSPPAAVALSWGQSSKHTLMDSARDYHVLALPVFFPECSKRHPVTYTRRVTSFDSILVLKAHP